MNNNNIKECWGNNKKTLGEAPAGIPAPPAHIRYVGQKYLNWSKLDIVFLTLVRTVLWPGH